GGVREHGGIGARDRGVSRGGGGGASRAGRRDAGPQPRGHPRGRSLSKMSTKTGDPCDDTAARLVERYRDGSLSPVEATRAVLRRIERVDPVLNAYCHVDAERALAAAAESEARWRKGEPLGALDGVPVSVKDVILARGWPTLRGSKTVDPKGPWNDDAPAVARLREAGAVLLGKTATPEFGWKGVTDSPLTGITRNPWNPAKTPGGSSGGAAAAVASGMGALALGT